MGNWDIEKFLLIVKSLKDYFSLKINIPILPGPDLACKAWVKRAYLRNTVTTNVYSSNVAPGPAIIPLHHVLGINIKPY